MPPFTLWIFGAYAGGADSMDEAVSLAKVAAKKFGESCAVIEEQRDAFRCEVSPDGDVT